MEDSIRIRMTSIMNAKLRAMVLFCQSERCKGSCQCEYTLQCCRYNPSIPIHPHPECGKILSNILLCDIGDIIGFGCTPRSSTPGDILTEAMKHRENAVPDREGKCLQTDSEIQSGTV